MISIETGMKDVTLDLLKHANISSNIVNLEPCNRGGNNRTYKLITDQKCYALKQYFNQVHDLRDRLASEYAFLSYANKVAAQWVPKTYAFNQHHKIALYEFIHGSALTKQDITINEIQQAGQFFSQLNQQENRVWASELPLASEACFSIQEHLNLVDRRVRELTAVSTYENTAAKQIFHELDQCWQIISSSAIQKANVYGLSLVDPLPEEQRCISPSDFGFHNALVMENKSLRFIDFEYAGWDDPAKMMGDFFSQLAVPVSPEYFDMFAEIVLSSFPRAEQLLERAKILYSVYKIKWCCIALNIFIPVNLQRRLFANPNLQVEELKNIQLTKVKKLLQSVEC